MSSNDARRYELFSSKLVKAGAVVEVLTELEVSPKSVLNESLVPDATRVVLSPPPKRAKSLVKSKDLSRTSWPAEV